MPAPLLSQIIVLDAGGQYCHLIARRIRELGVYSEVRPSETPASQLSRASGIVISGGPSSVYDPQSPAIDPAVLGSGTPVLGICYGQQLMAQLLGGTVTKGDRGEFGMATFETLTSSPLWQGLPEKQQVWMSHRDTVAAVPTGFQVAGFTSTCPVAAMADQQRRLYGLQFHPEVVHTSHGKQILAGFVFDVCGCIQDWDPKHRIPMIEAQIRETVANQNVFFFVSGGVDSTVAYTLCLRALGPQRVRGVYVDTGLMRDGETDFVRQMFDALGEHTVSIEDAAARFLDPLAQVCDPERKRCIIGEEFLEVQKRIIQERHLADGAWILGQGTIYPDTIESGGSRDSAVIKTHHNRVPGVQELLSANRIVEPLSSFYKDEVREIGRELGLPAELLERHPFPGPGLAIRCLCAPANAPLEPTGDGFVVPIRSVGVQGDSRTYAPVLATDGIEQEQATELINRLHGINRVITRVAGCAPLGQMQVFESRLSRERLSRLRRADAAVRRISHESGFDKLVWQFPVVVIPLGTPDRPDSVVLRPIDSVDGMTAQSVPMDAAILQRMVTELLSIDGVCGVFYDLTHKPPGTIEWE